MATLIPTYRCNSSCPKCVKKGMHDVMQEMTTEQLKRVIDELQALGISAIDFTGGEPLLRDDLTELLRHTSGKGLLSHLNTNGYLLTPERVQDIVQSGVNSINVSLDSVSPEKMEVLTGIPGALAKIQEGLISLLAARAMRRSLLEITIVTVLSKENRDELEAIIDFARKIGVDGVSINPYHAFPRPLSGIRDDSFQETIGKLMRWKNQGGLLENSKEYFFLLHKFFKGEPFPLRCSAADSYLIIDTYRRIFPCFCWLETGGRSISFTDSIRQAIQSEEYRQILVSARLCRACYWNCHAELSIFLNPFFRYV